MTDAEPAWWLDYAGYLLLLAAALILITLRLVGVVVWPWGAVFAPLWILLALYFGTYVVLRIGHRHRGA